MCAHNSGYTVYSCPCVCVCVCRRVCLCLGLVCVCFNPVSPVGARNEKAGNETHLCIISDMSAANLFNANPAHDMKSSLLL